MAYSSPEISRYLPDFNAKKPVSRGYLFNVNSIKLSSESIDCE